MSRQQVRALYDFVASERDELSFRKGDVITVLGRQEDWYSGELNGVTGIFPSNYVENVIVGTLPPIASSSAAPASPTYVPPSQSTGTLDDPRRTRLNMPLGIEAALTYFLGPVTGILFLMLEKENDYVRFHAWQACFAFLPLLLLHVIFIWTFAGSIVFLVLDILAIIFLMWRAHHDSVTLSRFKLPIAGNLAEKMNREENE